MAMDEAELLDVLHDHIRRRVAAGFDSYEEIVRGAQDCLDGEYDPVLLRARAERLTIELLSDHLREQQRWPDVTDCDRLDRAFDELEDEGIVCRHDFTCCISCGSGEIWGEVEQARRQGVRVRGYAFYHAQDTDAAVDGTGLHLAYAATNQEDGDEADTAVGQAIEAALQRNGLSSSWNGSSRQRIYVDIDWRRRR